MFQSFHNLSFSSNRVDWPQQEGRWLRKRQGLGGNNEGNDSGVNEEISDGQQRKAVRHEEMRKRSAICFGARLKMAGPADLLGLCSQCLVNISEALTVYYSPLWGWKERVVECVLRYVKIWVCVDSALSALLKSCFCKSPTGRWKKRQMTPYCLPD